MTSTYDALPVNFYVGCAPLPFSFHNDSVRLLYCTENPAAGLQLVADFYARHKIVNSGAVGGMPVEAIPLGRAYELTAAQLEDGKQEHSLWVTLVHVRTPPLYKEGVLVTGMVPGINVATPCRPGDGLVFRFLLPWQLVAYEKGKMIQAADVFENEVMFTLAIWDSGLADAPRVSPVNNKNSKRAAARKKAKRAEKNRQQTHTEAALDDT